MTKAVDEIAAEAKKLPPEEQGLLIAQLTSALQDQADSTVKSKWVDLAKKRLESIKNNEIDSIPADKVIREANDLS